MSTCRDWVAEQALPLGKGTIKIRRKNWAKLYLTLEVRLKEFSSEQDKIL